MNAAPRKPPAPKPRMTGQHALECPVCEGIGYTRETATRMREDGKRTEELGYGCLACRGTGRRRE